MKELMIESYGKVNLGLDVLYKREDGYHELSTIMQQISLKDRINIKEIKEGIIIESNNREIPLGSDNLVYKAWDILKERSGIDKGVYIKIHKEIPVAAGLAGGSTNAASVLKGLNELWGLKLSKEELRAIGKELGADVPYCIMGGTAWAQGIGEKLTRLKSFGGNHILLANPGIFISTAEVYGKLNLEREERVDIGRIISSIEKNDLKSVAENMENVMEGAVIPKSPIIAEIKKDMIKYGALGSLMSGSGPTVFGLFEDEDRLDYCRGKLLERLNKGIVIKAETI